ncbi:MAG TPA: hypothetical protein VHE78_19290 [Gemmatimonadaceae bacterium]|nr:hypothetical protein [Gemmatimonadaceae bacterium]
MVAGTVLLAAPIGAQAPHTRAATADSIRQVHGTVTLAAGTGGGPFPGVWVTLHRVGTDRSGALDSTRADARGRFSFRYRPTGDSSALYFVSSRYAGIAYFTQPLRKAFATGGDADLILYDTTSTPVPIHVRGRHIVVMAPDSARSRSVVEAYELSNDTSVTRVAGVLERPTFEAVLPDGARDLHATDGEVAAQAVSFGGGRVRVFAPLAPGLKQVSITYRLAASDKPIAVAALQPVTVLEVLVEDPKAGVLGAGLTETDPVVLDGRRFRRFLSHDTPANSVLSISAPTLRVSLNARIAAIVTAIGATMLLVLARSFSRRSPALARPAKADDPDALAREIAALDTAFANLDSPSAEQRADHYEARAHVTARRVAALQRSDRERL